PAPSPAPVPSPTVTSGDDGTPELSLAKEEAFIAEASKSSGMSAEQIRGWLSQARYQQSIIDAITKPAEGKPWKDYRPLFLQQARIDQGIAFYRSERASLAALSGRYGVPPEIMVAIVGVETYYGKNIGKYKALD